MIVCVAYGYLVGVLVGLLCACCLFAISYARIGVIRRHVTRAHFASNVDRSLEASQYLREIGDAIYLYWLSGYIFFGSSESVFERIREDIEAVPSRQVAFVILDFGMVPGADSSAFISLAKLRTFCDQRGITIVYASLSPANGAALERAGFFGPRAATNLSLTSMPRSPGAKTSCSPTPVSTPIPVWAVSSRGCNGNSAAASHPPIFLLTSKRKDIASSQVLYRQGEPADTVDLVAAGKLAIDIAQDDGGSLLMRRINTQTVIGEMGFFRQSSRSATVSSDGPVTLYTLTRINFEKMRRERPDLAIAFDDFIMRVLADRIEFAGRQVASLSR